MRQTRCHCSRVHLIEVKILLLRLPPSFTTRNVNGDKGVLFSIEPVSMGVSHARCPLKFRLSVVKGNGGEYHPNECRLTLLIIHLMRCVELELIIRGITRR